MKTTSYALTLLLVGGVIAFANPAAAEVIGADQFNEPDGTALGGRMADVGGTWSSNGQINSGAFDTAQFGGAHDGSFVDFTRALGPGEILTMTFTTLDTGGTMFSDGVSGNSYAGISLYVGGDEKFFVGDPAGGNDIPGTGWGLDGFAGGSGFVVSSIGAEAVTGTFTYAYDTGNASLTVSDGTSSDTILRTYDPNVAVNRLRIQAGDGTAEINVSSFEVSAAVPEPSTLCIAAVALVGLGIASRRSA
ncbi:PEP-CTERM sorting domain-containing protein [Aeoliella sp. ICT_H6.2]|uniref:PEP-CTERM sorting domain-containing protein n=1 Tax=Aeoliella straminimaris TaxID=2954799 RepID=A0A9X2JI46_9BACT|nr:PEP-CTERM sorting domain-containing protein [Aeoliella straminimaris]MCO6046720.1 PEP-CTERM sorting domain-containing protein [Aeoliella straminimaris]